MLLVARYVKLNRIVIVVGVVSMKMRVDWRGLNTKIDTRACGSAVSGGMSLSLTDTVMLKRRRFCSLRFFLVEMVPVLLRGNKHKLALRAFFNPSSPISRSVQFS